MCISILNTSFLHFHTSLEPHLHTPSSHLSTPSNLTSPHPHLSHLLPHLSTPYSFLLALTHCLVSFTGKDYSDKQGHDEVKVQAFLLFNEKQSFRKLGDVIYQQSKSGEIYVRRDALTVIFDNNKILYGNLVTYGGNGLQKLWGLVFTEGSTLLGKGLVALGFQSAVIVWINGKPKGLNSITGQKFCSTVQYKLFTGLFLPILPSRACS